MIAGRSGIGVGPQAMPLGYSAGGRVARNHRASAHSISFLEPNVLICRT